MKETSRNTKNHFFSSHFFMVSLDLRRTGKDLGGGGEEEEENKI